MATQSILKNIVITKPDAAEILVNAIEKAVEATETSISQEDIKYEDVTGEDILNNRITNLCPHYACTLPFSRCKNAKNSCSGSGLEK